MSERMQNLTGETIITVYGKKYKLGKLAGYGAQGVVYEDASGKKMIKLYYPSGSDIIEEPESVNLMSNIATKFA